MEIEFFFGQRFQEQGLELLPFLAVSHPSAAGVGHVKCVEDNAVTAGKDLGAKDVNSRGAEGAGDFAEETGPVPGAYLASGVAAVGFVVPREDRFERLVLFGELMV